MKGDQKTKKMEKIWNFFSENQFSVSYMKYANIWGPSDHSGRLQRPKPPYKVGLKEVMPENICHVHNYYQKI